MTGSNPLVSVVIPLYNAQKYINETIESVINQTYTNWELLVVDDCSTDNSIELVKEFENKDSRIRLIESETNFGGPARPRNIGIDNAKGEYIAFLDADDVWIKDKLEIQIKYMINYKIDFTSTNMLHLYENTLLKHSLFYKLKIYLLRDRVSLKSTFLFNIIFTSSVVLKKNNNFRFNEDKELIAVEDIFLWLQILDSEYKYRFLNINLLHYRLLISSISNHKNKAIINIRHSYAIDKYILLTKKYNLVLMRNIRFVSRFFKI